MSATFKWCKDRNKIKTFDKQVFCVSRYGCKYWFLNGKLHREDEPAIEYADGEKWWYLNGKLHRENGPAVEYSNDGKYWYLNGKHYSESAYWKELQKCA